MHGQRIERALAALGDEGIQVVEKAKGAQNPNQGGQLGGAASFQTLQSAQGNASFGGQAGLAPVAIQPFLSQATAEFCEHRSIVSPQSVSGWYLSH